MPAERFLCVQDGTKGEKKPLFVPEKHQKKKTGINAKNFAKTVDIRLGSEYYITVAHPSRG